MAALQLGAAPVATPLPPAATLAGTVGSYQVFAAADSDQLDGPTHQSGVFPGRLHEALRTPFGEVGVAGAGLERNVTDLDLRKNHHADDSPYYGPGDGRKDKR